MCRDVRHLRISNYFWNGCGGLVYLSFTCKSDLDYCFALHFAFLGSVLDSVGMTDGPTEQK